MADIEWDVKPSGKDAAPKARARRRTKTFYKEQCSALVAMGNLALTLVSEQDTLQDEEMDMLTDALVAECTASERISNWLEKAAGVSPHVLLIKAVALIAIPRLQNHGIIPSFRNEGMEDKIKDALRFAEQNAENYYPENQQYETVDDGLAPNAQARSGIRNAV